ncbi:hypothetical protein FMN50_07110 [Rhodobacterales bacterium]|nr:hypothetical protein FMN50_07110 [Rhodobacterales bacterium]
MARSDKRLKAKGLGAPEAEELVALVPHLARLLSKAQIAEIQKVLDAAVLNPMYEDAYRKAMRAAVMSRSGGLVLRDRIKERKARRILDKRLVVHRNDGNIRVDYTRMLTPDSLKPRTNNPDEADYLKKVRDILNAQGIWLRLRQPYEAVGRDPTKWEFWFSLGRHGDPIETTDAIIDREELFGTTLLGAGYYRSVLTGHVQTKLKRMFARFDLQYENGWQHHMNLMRHRHEAGAGVTGTVDLLGGAEFPSFSIWKRAHALRMKAWNANEDGDVVKAQVHLLVAASVVEHNALLLGRYLSRTIGGANTAMTILRVAETAGQIAEGVLLVTGVGVGVKALRAAGGKALTREMRDEATEQFVRDYCRRAGISEAELGLPRFMRQPNGTTIGNIRGGHSAGFGGGHHRWP